MFKTSFLFLLFSISSGSHLVGVQKSGELFVWHKDQDDLRTVCGLASLLLDNSITLGGIIMFYLVLLKNDII